MLRSASLEKRGEAHEALEDAQKAIGVDDDFVSVSNGTSQLVSGGFWFRL